MTDMRVEPPPIGEPALAELDLLLERLSTWPEASGNGALTMQITPQVVRWMLRGTFVSNDGRRARLFGGTLRGSQFTGIWRMDHDDE